MKSVIKAPNEIHHFESLVYPMFSSKKYDGFRGLNLGGDAFYSPALKKIPNINLDRKYKGFLKFCKEYGIVTDGEIWSPNLTFNELQSIIRSNNEPIPDSVGYYIFDMMTIVDWDQEVEPVFEKRYESYRRILASSERFGIFPVAQTLVNTPDEARALFERELETGGEGIMLRSPQGRYKHGRCTFKDMNLFKFKNFLTDEAVIVDVIQGRALLEGVERVKTADGKLERVHTQASYELAPRVGAFLVRWNDLEFELSPGRGWTIPMLEDMWKDHFIDPQTFIGKTIEFSYMPVGMKEKPRLAKFLRFRNE